jgi:uncharacterized protein with HEPN domain
MAARAPLLRIHDMLESIRGIEKAIAGKTFRDYQRSWLLRSAIERGIEVTSEASRHLGRDLKAQHKNVRWEDIAGIGNILRHEYQHVDAAIIWRAVKNDLPPLQGSIACYEGFLEVTAKRPRRDRRAAQIKYAGPSPIKSRARPRIANS